MVDDVVLPLRAVRRGDGHRAQSREADGPAWSVGHRLSPLSFCPRGRGGREARPRHDGGAASTGDLFPLISHHLLSSRFLLRCAGRLPVAALTDMVMAAAAAAAKMTGAVLLVPPWQCADGASHLLLLHDPARPPPPPPVVAVAHRCTEPHLCLTTVLPALVAAAVPFHPRCVAVLVVPRSPTSSSPAPRPPPHRLPSSSARDLLSPCLVPSPRTSPLPPAPPAPPPPLLHLLPLLLLLPLPLLPLLQRLSYRRPGCPRARDLCARPPQRTAWRAAAPSGWLVH